MPLGKITNVIQWSHLLLWRTMLKRIYAFLDLALKRDINAMKDLFAPNAISEIGEERLDGMLKEFVDYFEADSFTLEIPIGPSTSEYRDHGMESKELKGPLEIITDKNEYRFAIKCIALRKRVRRRSFGM